MVTERELVGLLYRADWTKLTLSGTVAGVEPVTDIIIVHSAAPPSGPWRRRENDNEPPSWQWEGDPPPAALRWLFERRAFERVAEQVRARNERASGPSWSFTPGREGAGCTLSVAPGQRFRADDADGDWALGCDGTRMWHWFRDRPADDSARFDFTGSEARFDLSGSSRPRPPYQKLLAPSWLLTGYSLTLEGEETVAGRAGVRVRGTLRTVAERTTRIGGWPGRNAGATGLFTPLPRWLSGPGLWDEQVEAVVDAELGILLRCSRWSVDEGTQVTGFSSLSVPGTADASMFSAPAESVFGEESWPPRPQAQPAGEAGEASGGSFGGAVNGALSTAGKEAAKAVAGLAAGGLGALIKYAPRPRVDPFTQAAAEAADPDAEMPADETAPDGTAAPASDSTGPDSTGPGSTGPGSTGPDSTGPDSTGPDSEALPDEILHAVYRSGLTPPSFGATLHQWFDVSALIAAVPEPVRGGGFGGVGFLLDALRDNARESAAGASHAVSTVRMSSWRRYRIDVVRSASDAAFVRPRRRDKDPVQTIVSDGEREWHLHADRIVTGPASPPPGELADLLDASWLLDPVLVLSGGGEITLGGRPGYRVVARYREDAWTGFDWWKRLFFPAVAVVDAETGLLLRLTRFKGGRPTMRQELRDIVEPVADPDFGFEPPGGLPVYDAESLGREHQPGARAWY